MTGSLSLSLLLERLHWPVPRVRWEAARQLARLIADCDRTAHDGLLTWGAALRLESDAVMLPSIVHAFGLQTHFSFDELHQAISAPSILSDALVGALYPADARRLFSFRFDYSRVAPPGSRPDPRFDEGLGTLVPLIFRSVLRTEQRRTTLPFIDQWRIEWQTLQDRFAEPYTSHPDYFFAGDRGSRGSLDVRQRAVFVSAYLRTLAAAHLMWGMPRSYAVDLAQFALPFNGALASFDASERQPWSTNFLGRFEAMGPVPFIRELWRKAAATIEPGFEPIALDVIDHNEDLAVRVQVQRALEGEAENGDAITALAPPAWVTSKGSPWSLEGSIPLAQWQADEPGLRPLCVAVHPEAFGRAHIDLYAGGRLLLADPLLATGETALACQADRITLTDAAGLLSTLHLWYADWTPTHPEDMTQTGSMTTCRSSALRDLRRDCHVRTPRLAKIRVARRKHSYEPFEFEDKTYRL